MNSQAAHVLEHIETEVRLFARWKSEATEAAAIDAYDDCLNRMYLLLRIENDRIEMQDGADQVDHEMRNVQLEVAKKRSEMSLNLIKYS